MNSNLSTRITRILTDLTDVTGWPNTSEAEEAFKRAVVEIESLILIPIDIADYYYEGK
jgi:hypothetical protein